MIVAILRLVRLDDVPLGFTQGPNLIIGKSSCSMNLLLSFCESADSPKVCNLHYFNFIYSVEFRLAEDFILQKRALFMRMNVVWASPTPFCFFHIKILGVTYHLSPVLVQLDLNHLLVCDKNSFLVLDEEFCGGL